MTWNHRVIRIKDDDQEGGYRYEFKEVYYHDDGTLMAYGDPFLWSEDLEGMQELAERLLKATTQPVLDENEFHENHNA